MQKLHISLFPYRTWGARSTIGSLKPKMSRCIRFIKMSSSTFGEAWVPFVTVVSVRGVILVKTITPTTILPRQWQNWWGPSKPKHCLWIWWQSNKRMAMRVVLVVLVITTAFILSTMEVALEVGKAAEAGRTSHSVHRWPWVADKEWWFRGYIYRMAIWGIWFFWGRTSWGDNSDRTRSSPGVNVDDAIDGIDVALLWWVRFSERWLVLQYKWFGRKQESSKHWSSYSMAIMLIKHVLEICIRPNCDQGI